MSLRYTVIARLKSVDYLDEFIEWLQGGHVQEVCERGAEEAEILILDNPENPEQPAVESSYIFPDVPTYENYVSNLSQSLREDMKTRFLDTDKVLSVERRTGYIRFNYRKHHPKLIAIGEAKLQPLGPASIPAPGQPFGVLGGVVKNCWPELLNIPAIEAKAIIVRERPDLKVVDVPAGAMVTMDHRMDRVRVYVNPEGNVSRPPRVG